jgi:hypothetical protein
LIEELGEIFGEQIEHVCPGGLPELLVKRSERNWCAYPVSQCERGGELYGIIPAKVVFPGKRVRSFDDGFGSLDPNQIGPVVLKVCSKPARLF